MYTFVDHQQKKAIKYAVTNEFRGWKISVTMPKRISPSDHRAVISWLHTYQRDVRSKHPNWLTTLQSGSQGYVLHIQKAETADDVLGAVNLLAKGNEVRDCWSGAVEYAG